MKTIMTHFNLRHILLALTLVLVGTSAYASVNTKAADLPFASAQQTIQQSEVEPIGEDSLVVEAHGEINFNEWESDFNRSLRESKATEAKKCKGKNCQFQNMQALDPSFDF